MPRVKVRCPKCTWRPDGRAHWQCEVCEHSFDTFATNARCPACGKTWLNTQCITCYRWTLHEDWYEEDWPVARRGERREERIDEPAPGRASRV